MWDEVRIAQRISDCALKVVGPAFRRRRDLTTGELTARDVIRASHDARVANCFLWNAPRAEAEAVERDVVLVRRLPGDRE